MAYLQANQRQLQALCQQYRVAQLSVFGSALTERFNPTTSDIDLAVTFGEVPLADYADNFFNLIDSLEEYFQRKVDLIEEKAIRNPYLRQSIDATKQQIYAA